MKDHSSSLLGGRRRQQQRRRRRRKGIMTMTMMIARICCCCCLAAALSSSSSTTTTNAFVVVTGTRSTSTSTTALFDTPQERIKKAGGGIPISQSDNSLFDPSVMGKVGDTDIRITSGYNYFPSVTSPSATAIPEQHDLDDCQAWLEEDNDGNVPPVFAKANQPVDAKLLGRGKLITDDAPGDIQHIVLSTPKNFRYVEGQSISVIPPGIDANTGKPHKPRLYSIASTRYGDLLDGNTVSLCVRRAQYTDPMTGIVDDTKKGICSNFLCNANVGDIVQIAGPVGKTMLLPNDPNADLIFVATGTGVAPFRGFMHRLFVENTIPKHVFNGKVWLVLGVPTTGGLLYHEEFQNMLSNNNDNKKLEITYAISREMQNVNGGKLYVQDVLTERSLEVFDRLEQGANIYFCGLKHMMPGILDALEQAAIAQNLNWKEQLTKYKNNHQWHVEVY